MDAVHSEDALKAREQRNVGVAETPTFQEEVQRVLASAAKLVAKGTSEKPSQTTSGPARPDHPMSLQRVVYLLIRRMSSVKREGL